jgi:hypothetical protein
MSEDGVEQVTRELAEVDEQIIELVRRRCAVTARMRAELDGEVAPRPQGPVVEALVARWTEAFGGPGELVARSVVNLCWLAGVAAADGGRG